MRSGFVLGALALVAGGLLTPAGTARADHFLWEHCRWQPVSKSCFPDTAPGFGYVPTTWRPWPGPVPLAAPAVVPPPAPGGGKPDAPELLPPPAVTPAPLDPTGQLPDLAPPPEAAGGRTQQTPEIH